MKQNATFRGVLASVALFVVIGVGMTPVFASEPLVELRWALGAIEADAHQPNAVVKDTELASGARLKFLVEPLAPASIYLLLLDSDDQVHVLYNEKTSVTAAEPGGDATYVPSGRHWFELDGEAGQETFFLLASAEPLEGLDKLLAKLESAGDADKKSIAQDVVQEVRQIYRAHRNFARPIEKPVMIGGQTRGSGMDPGAIDRLAMEISAERFYGKTITIDHRP